MRKSNEELKKGIAITILVCSIFWIFIGYSFCKINNYIKQQETKQESQQVIQQQISPTPGMEVKEVEGNLADFVSSYNISYKGNYYLFSSRSSDVYLMFLNELDRNVYQITYKYNVGSYFYVEYVKVKN